MKIKILLWSVLVIVIAGLAAGGYWWMSRPQVIIFSDDATLTLLKVDYGKRHTPPTTGKSPSGAGGGATARGNSFTTPNDALVLWVRIKYDRQQYHYFNFYLSDKAGTGCSQAGPRNWNNNGNQVVAVQFDTCPRRQGKFYVRVQEQGNGQEVSDKKFVVSNPAHKSYTAWTAEPLPITKHDDDVSMTLTKLVAGADSPYQRNQDDPEDAMNKGVQVAFHIERAGKPVTTWSPVSVETADATGNRASAGSGPVQWKDNEGTFTYQYGLWPDEPAWKLKFEFSQQSDFADTELWTVKNIPLQPGRQQDFWNFGNNINNNRRNTNSVFAETDLNGIHLKIFPATLFTDQNYGNGQMGGGLHIQASPSLPAGMRFTIVKLTDDQDLDVQNYNSNTSGNGNSTTYGYQLQNIAGVTNLNLSIALHKSRNFEFTVKPEKATAEKP
jgi:hypothetical protein